MGRLGPDKRNGKSSNQILYVTFPPKQRRGFRPTRPILGLRNRRNRPGGRTTSSSAIGVAQSPLSSTMPIRAQLRISDRIQIVGDDDIVAGVQFGGSTALTRGRSARGCGRPGLISRIERARPKLFDYRVSAKCGTFCPHAQLVHSQFSSASALEEDTWLPDFDSAVTLLHDREDTHPGVGEVQLAAEQLGRDGVRRRTVDHCDAGGILCSYRKMLWGSYFALIRRSRSKFRLPQ